MARCCRLWGAVGYVLLQVVGCCRLRGAAAHAEPRTRGCCSVSLPPTNSPLCSHRCIPAAIAILPVLQAGGTPAAHCLDAGINAFSSPSVSIWGECLERRLCCGMESRQHPSSHTAQRCPACPPPCSQHANNHTALRADGIHPPSARGSAPAWKGLQGPNGAAGAVIRMQVRRHLPGDHGNGGLAVPVPGSRAGKGQLCVGSEGADELLPLFRQEPLFPAHCGQRNWREK